MKKENNVNTKLLAGFPPESVEFMRCNKKYST